MHILHTEFVDKLRHKNKKLRTHCSYFGEGFLYSPEEIIGN